MDGRIQEAGLFEPGFHAGSSCQRRSSAGHHSASLLLLFYVNRVLTQTRAVLLQAKLFATWLAAERVVVVARLFANEKYSFSFLILLGHDWDQLPVYTVYRLIRRNPSF